MAESLRIGGSETARLYRAHARKYYRWAESWQRSVLYWNSRGDAKRAAKDQQTADERRQWAREAMQRARQIARWDG